MSRVKFNLSNRVNSMFKVFVRNWWRINRDWPNGLEPNPCAKKTTIRTGIRTEEEAQAFCQEYNLTHKPGRLSRKAEYTGEEN